MTFQPKLFDESDQIKCESPPLIPAEVVEISNVGEMEVHDYDIDALLTSVKEESLEKLAVILGELELLKTFPFTEKLWLYNSQAQPSLTDLLLISLSLICGTIKSRSFQNNILLFNKCIKMMAKKMFIIYFYFLGSRTVQLMTVIDESTGFTVLHYAVKRNLRAVVHMLIMAGMDVDTFDYEQNTPLMIAIHSFHNELAKYLIKVGAHISLKVITLFLLLKK